jgi:DNA-binding transcriptional LysR family regulator
MKSDKSRPAGGPLFRQIHEARPTGKSRPHDVRNLRVTLRQWRILHAVNDYGSFADAANFLHLSQSSISYTIAKLQDQLGVTLLRMEGRKAHITEAGRKMLESSRSLMKDALEIEALADNLRQGRSPEVSLFVDHSFPVILLMDRLGDLPASHRSGQLLLNEVSMPEVEKALRNHTADLVICSYVPFGFVGEPLVGLEYVAVAHPGHPLFGLGRPVTAADLERHVEILLGDASHAAGDTEQRTHVHRYWTVSGIETAAAAISKRLGYGWLPRESIGSFIEEGRMALLPLSVERPSMKTFYLVRSSRCTTRSSTAAWAEILLNLTLAEDTAPNPTLVVA